MAIYHLSIKKISKSKGKSAIASSAYIAGEKLKDAEIKKTYSYTKKKGVYYKEIMLPDNAPKSFGDRQTLWTEVQKIEKASNAVLARETIIALPKELASTKEGEASQEHIAMCREFVYKAYVSKGMCADFAIHCSSNKDNWHAHIMTTVRAIEADGSWCKKERKIYSLDENGNRIPIIDEKTGLQKVDKENRKQWKREKVLANDWNKKENVKIWREDWANICNKYIDRYNLKHPELAVEKVDHRSYADAGINKIPTVHEGWFARLLKKKFGSSVLTDKNDEIRQMNKELILFEELKKDFNKAMEIVKAKTEELREWFKNNFDDVEPVKKHRRKMSL